MSELLPCPFCGGAAEHHHRPDPTGFINTDWGACIDDCGASTCMHETEEQAIAAWNTRSVTAALALPEIAALVEADRWQTKKRAQHWLRRTMTAPEDADVDALCKKHGYGAVIDAASRLWARGPGGSAAFYVGGCIGFTSDDAARAALAAIEAEKGARKGASNG